MFGELNFTGNNDPGFIHVFFPPDQSGIFRFRVGNLDPGWVISITARGGVTKRICFSQAGYYRLKDLFASPDDTATSNQGAPALPYSDDWQYFDNIYLLTFRLVWYDSSEPCKIKYPPPEGTVKETGPDGKLIVPHPVRLTYLVAVNPRDC
jgi:hypothetical protein